MEQRLNDPGRYIFAKRRKSLLSNGSSCPRISFLQGRILARVIRDTNSTAFLIVVTSMSVPFGMEGKCRLSSIITFMRTINAI